MGVNNSLAKKDDQKMPLSVYLTQDAIKNHINNVVGGASGQRFISSIVSAVTTNTNLQKCTNQSLLSAALLGESLKLSPSPQLGHYYLVPYAGKAQFQLGYKGLIQLATRSGMYKRINVMSIKEGELVRFDPLNEDIEVNLIEDEETRENTPTAGYYAMFEYNNGFRKAIYWSRAKMEAHARKYSSGYASDLEKGTKNTFWVKDFDAMAYKTMLRQLISKWGVMSIEMQTAYTSDMAVIREDGTPEYVDNVPEVIDAPQVEETKEPPKAEASAEDVLFG